MDHAITFSAKIEELSTDGISLGVPDHIYNEIKANDPNPFWVKLEVGREGVSGGALSSLGKVTKRWTSMSIKELASKIKGALVFTDNHGDPGDTSRKSFGRIVSGIADKVAGKTTAYAIAYIKDQAVRDRIKSGELNICSIEGMVNAVQSAGEFIVDSVASVGGLLIAAGSKEVAGFANAGVLQSVQELGEPNNKGEKMTIELKDVRDFIVANGTAPEKLYGAEQLANCDIVKGIANSATEEAKANAVKENQKVIDEMKVANDALVARVKPFEAEESKKRLSKMMEENHDIKQLPKIQAQAVIDLAVKNIGDIEGKTDAELAIMATGQIATGIDFVKQLSGKSVPQGNLAPEGVQPGDDENPFMTDGMKEANKK